MEAERAAEVSLKRAVVLVQVRDVGKGWGTEESITLDYRARCLPASVADPDARRTALSKHRRRLGAEHGGGPRVSSAQRHVTRPQPASRHARDTAGREEETRRGRGFGLEEYDTRFRKTCAAHRPRRRARNNGSGSVMAGCRPVLRGVVENGRNGEERSARCGGAMAGHMRTKGCARVAAGARTRERAGRRTQRGQDRREQSVGRHRGERRPAGPGPGPGPRTQ
ncbi:hypothetical protein B0H14DRAFT_1588464 [Mycena olivaceomarginata]|nr:hypothetical protein B0H14DRAFT_1588464 [Mycena olivaceomarginata]